MRRLVPAFAVLSCLLAAAPAAAGAEEPFDALYARLTKAQEILGVAISPDGSHVARVEPVRNEKVPRASRILVQAARPGAPAVRITASLDGSPLREGKVAFSPDGKTLAFVSHAGGAALWTAPVSGGRASRLTKIKRHVPGAALVPRRTVPRSTRHRESLEGARPDGPHGPRRGRRRGADRRATHRRRGRGDEGSALRVAARPLRLRVCVVGGRTLVRGRRGEGLGRRQLVARRASRGGRGLREPRVCCGSRLSRSRTPSSRPTARPWRSFTAS